MGEWAERPAGDWASEGAAEALLERVGVEVTGKSAPESIATTRA